ncbi:MAG: hypothetical protein Q4B75_10800 [Eubacteriales bacterium]|nr:hypothetical protein [Eubacteriales bacterium]
MIEFQGKTKPELWRQIEDLQQRLRLLEDYLIQKGLLNEAEAFVEETLEKMEDLPFN